MYCVTPLQFCPSWTNFFTVHNSLQPKQLTEETYGAAVAMLSQAVGQTGDNEIEQNEVVLNTVANYFEELATFVNASNVTVNVTVSQNYHILNSYCIVVQGIIIY